MNDIPVIVAIKILCEWDLAELFGGKTGFIKTKSPESRR